MRRPSPSAAISTWRSRWGGIAPLLLAEFIVWLGFGGLLPVLSIYFTEQGIDFATLGVVIAAWPAARLVGEPIFGWLADRTARVPLMVAGLVLAGVFTVLPLVITGAVAFILLRAAVGLATSIYDPAARGYLTDATPPERRGEAFGLYGAAQMGGLLIGPAIGAIGAGRLGGIAFVFVFAGVAAALAAVPIARLKPEGGPRTRLARDFDTTEIPLDSPTTSRRAANAVIAEQASAAAPSPGRLLNRGLVAALVINVGANFAAGTYDVIWSPWLTSLGGSPGLVGLTFSMFSIPVLVLGPIVGRFVDRRGTFAFIVVGSCMVGVASFMYTLVHDPIFAVGIIVIESTGFAIIWPALYAIVADRTPSSCSARSSRL